MWEKKKAYDARVFETAARMRHVDDVERSESRRHKI